jgi:phage-related minor tail protein
MGNLKEIDMNSVLNTTLAALAACLLTLGSIGAIVTVPPAQAETPAAFALPAIA